MLGGRRANRPPPPPISDDSSSAADTEELLRTLRSPNAVESSADSEQAAAHPLPAAEQRSASGGARVGEGGAEQENGGADTQGVAPRSEEGPPMTSDGGTVVSTIDGGRPPFMLGSDLTSSADLLSLSSDSFRYPSDSDTSSVAAAFSQLNRNFDVLDGGVTTSCDHASSDVIPPTLAPEPDPFRGVLMPPDVERRFKLTSESRICGQFSNIYFARDDDQSDSPVAIKQLLTSSMTSSRRLRALRELRVLRHLDHSNLLHLVTAFRHRATVGHSSQQEGAERREYWICYVTPRCQTTVDRLIREHPEARVGSHHIQFILDNVLCGLLYLHAAGILHMDLQSKHIGLTYNARNQTFSGVKVMDFGMCGSCSDRVVGGAERRHAYMAPEVLLRSGCYTDKVDSWGLGCVMADLLLWRPVFPDVTQSTAGSQSDCEERSPAALVWCLSQILSVCGNEKCHEQTMNKFLACDHHNIDVISELIATEFDFGEISTRTFFGANPRELETLKKLLAVDPEERWALPRLAGKGYFTRHGKCSSASPVVPVKAGGSRYVCYPHNKTRLQLEEELDLAERGRSRQWKNAGSAGSVAAAVN